MTFKPVDTAIVMVVGPCIDDTDFKSLEEAIAYDAAGMDVSLIVEKTDGTTAVTPITLTTAGTSDWTHKDGGYYEIEVTAAQNIEEGTAYIRGICTGVLPFESPRYEIVKANVYDSLVKGTDILQADVTQLAGVVQSLTDLKDLVDTGYNPTDHKIQGVVLADTVTGLTGHTAQTGDSFARLGTPAGVSIAADLVVIDNFVDDLETRLSAVRAGYLDNLSAGAVALNSGVNVTKLNGNAGAANGLYDFAIYGYDTVTSKINGVKLVDAVTALSATAADLILKDSTFALAIADAIWDEILTGNTHNIATSAGRRVREIAGIAIHTGTAQAGTTTTITLAAAANGGDGVYNRNLLAIIGGTGQGQTRAIVDYNNTTKVVLVDREWRITPDATSEYQILAADTPLVVDHGLTQASTNSTITIRSYASAVDDIYKSAIITIMAGTGRGQSRIVTAYNGTTKVVTLCSDWVTNPDTTSVYAIMPYGISSVACMSASALADINTQCDTALADYDGPTRAEVTTDKDAIVTEINANETKIDLLNDITVADIIAGIADGSYDLQEMVRIMFAALSGKSSGGGTTTLRHRDSADTKERITATVDAHGNRTSMTLDGS